MFVPFLVFLSQSFLFNYFSQYFWVSLNISWYFLVFLNISQYFRWDVQTLVLRISVPFLVCPSQLFFLNSFSQYFWVSLSISLYFLVFVGISDGTSKRECFKCSFICQSFFPSLFFLSYCSQYVWVSLVFLSMSLYFSVFLMGRPNTSASHCRSLLNLSFLVFLSQLFFVVCLGISQYFLVFLGISDGASKHQCFKCSFPSQSFFLSLS